MSKHMLFAGLLLAGQIVAAEDALTLENKVDRLRTEISELRQLLAESMELDRKAMQAAAAAPAAHLLARLDAVRDFLHLPGRDRVAARHGVRRGDLSSCRAGLAGRRAAAPRGQRRCASHRQRSISAACASPWREDRTRAQPPLSLRGFGGDRARDLPDTRGPQHRTGMCPRGYGWRQPASGPHRKKLCQGTSRMRPRSASTLT